MTNEPLTASARYRVARKTWMCICADPGYRHPDIDTRAAHCNRNHTGCSIAIAPGEVYVEYLGESTAFESGRRYCLTCGVQTWAASKWVDR